MRPRRESVIPGVIARVLPDVPAIDRAFDYVVPAGLVGQVRVGTIVRVPLQGRRVRGWVVALPERPETDRPLHPVAKVTGWGPAPDVVELARWAAWRWAGPVARFLATASPPTAVRHLPDNGGGGNRHPSRDGNDGVVALRVPPAADLMAPVFDAAGQGDALVLAPSLATAAAVARGLRAAGHRVALVPREWERAAAGGCVAVGTRAAAWAPRRDLAAVVVLDEHDEVFQEERAPTWNAREVVMERARRARVACVLTSPCPSLEALSYGPLQAPSRAVEREGWPAVEVVDRRRDDPRLGLYSDRLTSLLRESGRVVCVLNRKGRGRLLACVACGELARCQFCEAAMAQDEGGLVCTRCARTRPVVCLACGATALKVLRVGVTRAREELEALAGRPVDEVTGEGDRPPATGTAGVVVGTEAALHRVDRAEVVAFLDFDQELLAPRYRAAEQALALLARAARIVGGRSTGGRILVQTRLPTHEAVDAAVHADPSRLAVVESARRAALRFPPESALAMVSGPAAPAFLHGLPDLDGLETLGPAGDRWLVRAPDHRTLCEALAMAPRPPGRLRVSVDPLRA